MSLSKHTKADLLEMLSSQGIDAKSSMKKVELIALLENAPTTESTEAAVSAANTESEAKPSASQPVFLVVGVFIALAILAWIIL
jgi:hypothetical protein